MDQSTNCCGCFLNFHFQRLSQTSYGCLLPEMDLTSNKKCKNKGSNKKSIFNKVLQDFSHQLYYPLPPQWLSLSPFLGGNRALVRYVHEKHVRVGQHTDRHNNHTLDGQKSCTTWDGLNVAELMGHVLFQLVHEWSTVPNLNWTQWSLKCIIFSFHLSLLGWYSPRLAGMACEGTWIYLQGFHLCPLRKLHLFKPRKRRFRCTSSNICCRCGFGSSDRAPQRRRKADGGWFLPSKRGSWPRHNLNKRWSWGFVLGERLFFVFCVDSDKWLIY